MWRIVDFDAIRSQAARRRVDCLGHVNQCGAVAGRLRPTAADGSPRVVVIDGRPFMFWTQEEAQEWADALNDLTNPV